MKCLRTGWSFEVIAGKLVFFLFGSDWQKKEAAYVTNTFLDLHLKVQLQQTFKST